MEALLPIAEGLPVVAQVTAVQCFTIGIPSLMMIVGALSVARTLWEYATSERAYGTVIRQLNSTNRDGHRLYRSVFSVQIGDEPPIEVSDSMAFRPAMHRIGQQVLLMYPAGRPQAAKVARLWVAMIFAGLLLAGAVLLTLALTRVDPAA